MRRCYGPMPQYQGKSPIRMIDFSSRIPIFSYNYCNLCFNIFFKAHLPAKTTMAVQIRVYDRLKVDILLIYFFFRERCNTTFHSVVHY